ncbi:LuxR C-terminal-related transcriptional regulator [Chitinophaga barathri]|uniref:HTH luxR-type domain-containing protein n=1 Tax=Chitinophaga barathri TaxID=1647451 RepID=A0A3N4MIN0_9BACT|nr:LuxR C-terminal-related transcriptional regulator [Chitinophaga barathri]RPD39519.1 hypothetical protein EG028_20610 [Chitinophaga barathri]
MQTTLTLARKTNSIFAQTAPGHIHADDIHEEIIHTLYNLQKIFPRWVICTCRLMHKGFFYVSENAGELLGLDPALLSSLLDGGGLFKRLHPADVEGFTNSLQLIGELIQQEDPEDLHKIRFIFNYRMQHPDGRYMHMHDEKAMLPLKNDLNLHYMLMRDISEETPFTGVKMTAYKDGKKILEYNASAQAVSQLSPRENELLPLMKQGFSTKEIAHFLGISHHTVRNMRQKLFQKFHVNNAIELLNKINAPGEQMSAIAGAKDINDWPLSSAV